VSNSVILISVLCSKSNNMAIFVLIHVHTWIIDWIGHFENMFGKMEILLVYHLATIKLLKNEIG